MADVTPETPAATPAPAPKKKTNLVPILIVIGVIVVVIIGVGVWKLTSDSGTSKPAGAPPPKLSKNLYTAWQGDNRSAAAKIATAGAVSQIFAIPTSEGQDLKFGGCSKVGDTQLPKTCVYSRPGGELTFTVNLQGGKRTITSVKFGPAGLPPTTTG